MTRTQLVRPHSRHIAEESLAGLHAERLVREALRGEACQEALCGVRLVHVVAVGKAAVPMASAVRAASGDAFASGIAVPAGFAGEVPGVTVVPGDHPVPGERSRQAARAVRRFLATRCAGADDLVVFAVSGGGSALISDPVAPLDLCALGSLTTGLLSAGVDITSVNELRRAVSGVHGGALLPLAGPARRLGPILSDNVQTGAASVASGLTYAVPVDPERAHAVLDRAAGFVPDRVVRLTREAIGRRPGPEPGSTAVVNVEVGTPRSALDRCVRTAESHGYHVVSMGAALQGEARDVAARLGSVARGVASVVHGPVCLVGAGEVTVSVRGRGRGGRCQELAWAMMPEITGLPGASFTALATDGCDFLPGVMGACVGSGSLARARAAGVDWRAVLDDNDTHRHLDRLGLCLRGRETRTNLCDVYALTWESRTRW